MKSCLLWPNLLADLLRFLVLGLRSKSSLAAENLFLRKQLAFYQERRIQPRRTSHPTRLTLRFAWDFEAATQKICQIETDWRSRVNSNSRATFDWRNIIRKRAMALAPFRPQLTSKAILRSE
jgi:hypothetical protein